MTDEVRQEKEAWEVLFSSFGWQMILRHFGPRAEGFEARMASANDLLEMGRVQGERTIITELLGLETAIETELRYKAAYQAEPLEVE
jgi:hypothetical protein